MQAAVRQPRAGFTPHPFKNHSPGPALGGALPAIVQGKGSPGAVRLGGCVAALCGLGLWFGWGFHAIRWSKPQPQVHGGELSRLWEPVH